MFTPKERKDTVEYVVSTMVARGHGTIEEEQIENATGYTTRQVERALDALDNKLVRNEDGKIVDIER